MIAAFPLRMVRACVKFPQSRITWRGNQYRTMSVIYGRLAPTFPYRAKLQSETI